MSLLREDDRSDSTPRLESTKAHPARRSESNEEPSESCPGADVERWAGFLRLVPLEEGLMLGVCEMGRCRMSVMAYMGLLRMCEA
jgi:hypothetical protein